MSTDTSRERHPFPVFGWVEAIRLCALDRSARFSWRRFGLDALLIAAAVVLYVAVRRPWGAMESLAASWWGSAPAAVAAWAVFTCTLRPPLWWFARLSTHLETPSSLSKVVLVWVITCSLAWTGMAAVLTWGVSGMFDLPAVRALVGAGASPPYLTDLVSWRGIVTLGLFPLWPWLIVGLPFLLLPRVKVRA